MAISPVGSHLSPIASDEVGPGINIGTEINALKQMTLAGKETGTYSDSSHTSTIEVCISVQHTSCIVYMFLFYVKLLTFTSEENCKGLVVLIIFQLSSSQLSQIAAAVKCQEKNILVLCNITSRLLLSRLRRQ